MDWIEMSVVLAMVAFNGVFAAYEIALAATTTARLRAALGEGRSGARAAVHMKENVEGSLAAIQLGITLFGAVAAATGGASAEEHIAPWLQERWSLGETTAEFLALAMVVAPITALSITLGELVPKIFALRNKEWVCLRMSPAMACFALAVWPAVWIFETLASSITDWGERRFGPPTTPTRSEHDELQELRASASLARTSRLIGTREEGIIHGAARLASRPVREIQLPASAMNMLHADASLAQALVAAHLDMHTRFPVAERAGDPQSIVGYVNVKDVVATLHLAPASPSLRAITRQLPSFADSDSISSCLERLMRDGGHIALVRDARGAVTGMITLEDILEELLGDIRDEYDRLPANLVPTGMGWVAGGGVTLARLRERTGWDLESPSANDGRTLDDWIVGRLGRGARGGDVLEAHGLRVVVRKARRQRVLEAQLTPS